MATWLVHFHLVALEIIEFFSYSCLWRTSKKKIWEKLQRLSTQTAASKALPLPPFSMLHASFRSILRPWMILLNSLLTLQGPSISSSWNVYKHEQQCTICAALLDTYLHVLRLNSSVHFCFSQQMFIFRTAKLYDRFRLYRPSVLGSKAQDN